MHPTSKAARSAGALYLLTAVLAPFSLIYVPSALIVWRDATATAKSILAHETLFRVGIVADLTSLVIFIFLVMALYRLLSGVSKTHAALMVALVLVSVALGFMNELNHLAALTLFRGADVLAAMAASQREAQAMLFLRLYGLGTVINEIFWGLWLLPFGILVFRSRFLPRVLGVWLVVNGFAYLALSLTGLLLPQCQDMAFRIALPAMFGELAIALWLLIMGAKVPRPQVPPC